MVLRHPTTAWPAQLVAYRLTRSRYRLLARSRTTAHDRCRDSNLWGQLVLPLWIQFDQAFTDGENGRLRTVIDL